MKVAIQVFKDNLIMFKLCVGWNDFDLSSEDLRCEVVIQGVLVWRRLSFHSWEKKCMQVR